MPEIEFIVQGGQHPSSRQEIRASTTSFAFPGGEVQVRLRDPNAFPERPVAVAVLARVQSAEDLVRLILATELARDTWPEARRTLLLPYCPYARQDRAMVSGEAFSLKAIARVINGLGYDRVVTCDPHSDVTPALLERVEVVSQLSLVRGHPELSGMLADPASRTVIISPDAGAAKKALAVARSFALPIVYASKLRDPATGEITSTVLTADRIDSVGGKHAVIIDDVYTTDSFLSEAIEQDHPCPIPLHVSPLTFHPGGTRP
jgi:ribose-phosphate pyrophosphokinase